MTIANKTRTQRNMAFLLAMRNVDLEASIVNSLCYAIDMQFASHRSMPLVTINNLPSFGASIFLFQNDTNSCQMNMFPSPSTSVHTRSTIS